MIEPQRLGKPARTKRGRTAQIRAWEDDPASTRAEPVLRETPDLKNAKLHISISGKEPDPALYDPGTAEFRFWVAAEALRRAANFWAEILPGTTTWQPGKNLTATLDHGKDLNAYYDRVGLWFFHARVSGHTIYSGESPDVLCHELGHAVLDAIRPELWDLLNGEIAAFHESFGDISAILSGLSLQSVREAVLTETDGKLYRSCRVSRLAEQLGWAIRQGHPDAVEPDCLRNAVNSFLYRPLEKLPDYAPASHLSAEPHSFSRVFTAGFFEALSGMLQTQADDSADSLDELHLEKACTDMARILIKGILSARGASEYFAEIAVGMIEADRVSFDGKYSDVLKSAFVRRGILSLRSAMKSSKTLPKMEMVRRPIRTKRVRVPAEQYGLKQNRLIVTIPNSTTTKARAYLDYLFRRGRVAIGEHGDERLRLLHPHVRKTHKVVPEDGDLKLVRTCFDCGFGD